MPFSKKEAASYLAGIFDGEGSMRVRESRHAGSHCLQVCVNTEWSIIESTSECLEVLGIPHAIRVKTRSKSKPHWKKAWEINIWKNAHIEKFFSLVPVRSSAKRAKFEEFRAVPRHKGAPPYEVLHELYVKRRKSYAQIMKALGARSTGTVHRWLAVRGIEPRSLSVAGKIAWKEGPRAVH